MKSRYWHWAGVGLCVLGVAYLSRRLLLQADQLLLADIPGTAWWAAGVLSLLYAASNLFLGRAWWELLRHQRAELAWPDAVRIYGMSQLAKYVPGNLFHLVGRQALGLAHGVPGGALARSAGWEMLSLAVGACLFSAGLLQLVFPTSQAALGAALFVMGLVAFAVCAKRLGSAHLARAFVWHVLFLSASGGMFAVTFGVLSDQPATLNAMTVLSAAYVLAWLVGLVTPGAPAGLGVREAALILLLESASYEPANLLLAVLVMRCVTVVGDLIFFGFAWLRPLSQRQAPR